MGRRERVRWLPLGAAPTLERVVSALNERLQRLGSLMTGTIVRKNSGTDDFERTRLNFIEGSNVTLTVTDDPTNDEIDITIAATGASGAPSDATYIVQTANAGLSAEQALSTLTTGVVKVTNGTGVLSTAVADTDYAAATHATRHKNGGADEILLHELGEPTSSVEFAQQQGLQFVVENRTSDPGSPVTGQLWIRTDL
jgi:hypothetical protein